MLLDGLHLPLTTPFYPDGRLYLRKLEHNVGVYSRTPAAGLAVLTGVGEGDSLTDTEIFDVLRTTAKIAAPEKLLSAAIARPSTAHTLELARAAEAEGFDAVLLRAPLALGHSSDPRTHAELLTYFRVVADQSPVPIILISGSSAAGRPLPTDLIAEMARHPQVFGMVEMEPSPQRLQALQAATEGISREVPATTVFAAVTRRMLSHVPPAAAGANYIAAETLTGGATALAAAPPRPALKTRTRRVGFQILTGRTNSLYGSLTLGAAAAMLPLSACAPQACYEVYAAWKDGDGPLAEEKQARLAAAAATLEEGLGIAALKYGCDRNGYFGGAPRLPLLPLTGPDRKAVETALAALRS